MTPSSEDRYARQLALSGFGYPKQQALRDAHVSVVGAGGLGSPVLLYLAGAGIGHLNIIDDDQVALVNLHRQIIHS
ncbi:MAG: molybdopterin biosynthesis protein MoeB, partial [Actinomycetales bacterium]